MPSMCNGFTPRLLACCKCLWVQWCGSMTAALSCMQVFASAEITGDKLFFKLLLAAAAAGADPAAGLANPEAIAKVSCVLGYALRPQTLLDCCEHACRQVIASLPMCLPSDASDGGSSCSAGELHHCPFSAEPTHRDAMTVIQSSCHQRTACYLGTTWA